MASASRPSKGPRQTWRERSRPAESGEPKHIRRWLGSALVLVLVAILAWRLWLFFLPNVVVASLGPFDYKLLTVPPVPYSQNDFEAFARAGIACRDLSTLQTYDGMSALSETLREIIPRSRDTLILQIGAHGVVLDAKAYLLCGDFAAKEALQGGDSQLSGCFEISRLLAQVRQCPAGEKILILDSGHLPIEPRLGLLVNEFPKLLAQAVVETRDPHLWVISSHSANETSYVSHADRRGVLSHFLIAGLGGQADVDPKNRVVDLAELAGYVGGQVSQWVQTNYGSSQTPQLLWGGGDEEPRALVKRMRGIRLPLAIAKPKPAEGDVPPKSAAKNHSNAPVLGSLGISSSITSSLVAQAADPRAASPQATSPQTPAPSADQKADSAATPVPSEGATPAAAAPPASKMPSQPASSALESGADAKGAAKAPTTDATSESTPAPRDIWTLVRPEWEARDALLDRGGRFGWNPVDYAPHLMRELEQSIISYEARLRARLSDATGLARHVSAEFQDLKRVIERHLNQARQEFLASVTCKSLERDEFAALRKIVQLRNDCIYSGIDLTAFQAQANWKATRTSPLFERLRRYLVGVTALDRELAKLVEGPAGASQLPSPSARAIDELLVKARELEEERKAIERQLGTATQPREIEDRLSVALTSAPARGRLLTSLDATGKGLVKATTATETAAAPLEAIQRLALRASSQAALKSSWDRAREQIDLEVALIRLADREVLAGWSSAAADEQATRQASAEISRFYRALPGRVIAHAGEQRLAERELRLVTGADAMRIPDHLNPIPHVRWTGEAAGRLVFDLDSTKPEFASGKWRIEGQLKAEDGSPGAVTLELRYDPRQLRVTTSDATLPVDATQPRSIDKPLPIRLIYEIQPVTTATADTNLTLVATGATGSTASVNITCAVPPPDAIELVVTSADELQGTALVAGKRPGRMLLSTYPGHETTFEFKLQHQSRRPRTVGVQLLSVPEGEQERLKELVAQGQVDRLTSAGATRLVAVESLKLPETNQPVPIAFAPFPPPLAKDPPPTGVAPVAAPEPPSVAGGMIAIVRDLELPDSPPSLTWIDVAPWAPRQYVAVTVDYVSNELTADLALLGRYFPQDNKPIPVRWELRDDSGPVSQEQIVNSEVELSRENGYRGQLKARIPRDVRRQIEVRLSVDGYPRAFVYQVPLREIGPFERQRGLQRIEVASPRADDAFGAPPGRTTRVEVPIEIRVTAPDDSFRPGDNHRVELGIDRGDGVLRDRLWTRPTDRQIAMRMKTATADGRITIDTTVGDFQFILQHASLNTLNARAQLIARVLLADRDEAASDAVRVIFDHSAPKVTNVDWKDPVYQGEAALLVVSAEDELSGVASVSLAPDTNGNGVIDPEERKSAKKVDVSDRAARTFNLEWKTSDVPLGDHGLLVWATDRVGIESDRPYRATVRVVKKPEPVAEASKAAAPVKGRIEARVDYGGPVANIQVTLEGPAKRSATSDASGVVVFEGLPPGDYTLKAKGIARNSNRSGETTATVPDTPRRPVSATIPLK